MDKRELNEYLYTSTKTIKWRPMLTTENSSGEQRLDSFHFEDGSLILNFRKGVIPSRAIAQTKAIRRLRREYEKVRYTREGIMEYERAGSIRRTSFWHEKEIFSITIG